MLHVGSMTTNIRQTNQHCSEDNGPMPIRSAMIRVFQDRHHGRNKPFMQDVVDALAGTWLQLSLATCSSGTAAPSMAAPSFKSVSLGNVLCPSESSPGYAKANGCLMFMSSSHARSPAPFAGFSLNSGWGCAPPGAALQVQAPILFQRRGATTVDTKVS